MSRRGDGPLRDSLAGSFATWRALPCNVFLGVHGSFVNLDGKRDRL